MVNMLLKIIEIMLALLYALEQVLEIGGEPSRFTGSDYGRSPPVQWIE